MASIKQWIKNENNSYELLLNDNSIGSLQLNATLSQNKALATIGNRNFTIERIGFWKSRLQIKDDINEIVLEVVAEKWHSSVYKLSYKNTDYRLLVRNNPLSEWAIQKDGKDICAYGLHTFNGTITVKITETENQTPLLFHFLLWYLFVPIAMENQGDNFMFTMMLAAQ